MELRYYAPRADLRDFIGIYYVFETTETVLQPMCAELGHIRLILCGGGRIF